MNFASYLIDELKKQKGFATDADAVNVLPKMTKGALYSIKKGERPMTEEQALYIANECDLNPEWVLVRLAEHNDKNEEAKKIWHNLAKKLSKSVTAAALALILIFSGLDAKQPDSAVLA
ncbi:DUF3693 domain-containing protein [Rheinheimera fenheensis]|uniref:DUF3693 domain-containing protein n=1 Tax=Rheinheimera fenheensis TaxID=3152295 RepID=UPI003260CF60